MQRLYRLLTVDYAFRSPRAQQQSRIIQQINRYLVWVVLGLVVLGTLFFDQDTERLLFIGAAAALAGMIGGTTWLLRTGRAQAASLMVVYMTLVLVLGLNYFDEQPSQTLLALLLPIVMAGLLLDTGHVSWTTATAAVGLVVIATVQEGRWELAAPGFIAAMPAILIIVFLGAIQRLLTRESDLLFGRLNRADTYRQVTVDIGKALPPERDQQALLRQFGLVLQDVLDAHQVQFFLRDANNPNLIRLVAGMGVAAQRAVAQGRSISIVEDNPVASVLRSKDPMIVRSTSEAVLQTEMLTGTRSEAMLPMMCNGVAVGVLDVQSTELMDFEPEKMAVLAALANVMGAAVLTLRHQLRIEEFEAEQARLYAHLERNATETQRLRRQIAGVIWDRFFRERGKDVLGFDILRDQPEPAPAEALTDTMAATMEAGAVDMREVEGGYVLTVPIRQRDMVLGVMEFEIQREDALPPHIIDFAAVVAERLALALDNARLVEQTQAIAYREQQVSAATRRLQAADNMETLIQTAVEAFNAALGGVQTHIRLEMADTVAGPQASENGGGAE
ncbi:MAG: hypothetical protein Kow0077_25780 [Anaerolineae bacterium]